MRKLLIVLGALIVLPIYGQESVPLWNGNMPNSRGLVLQDSVVNFRMRQVGTPRLEFFRPSTAQNKGAAVIVCPSGGYGYHTYESSYQLAKWFNTLGINAFVLMSRLPGSRDLLERDKGPIQDAQRAMKIIRARAAEWNIDTTRIGIMGCSAGGHLAATLGTYPEDIAKVGDRYDAYSVRPAFMIMVSPVITMGEYAHQGSKLALLGNNPSQALMDKYSCEKQVTRDTPKTFLVHADNDTGVSSMNSILFYMALKARRVQASIHIFPYGAHAIALINNPGSTRLWPQLCQEWLYETEIIK